MNIIVLGSQWGDEGKGKLVDLLVNKTSDTNIAKFSQGKPSHTSLLCVRFNGGHNAGHTVIANIESKRVKLAFHLLPSGLVSSSCVGVIASGCVVHLPTLHDELCMLETKGIPSPTTRLILSDRAQMVFDWHAKMDEVLEKNREITKEAIGGKVAGQIGTTKRGIGPAYSDKCLRVGLRLGDLISQDFESKLRSLWMHMKFEDSSEEEFQTELLRYKKYADYFRPMIADTAQLLYDNRNISTLFEGANASMLDIDHGTYPFVTSSPTCIGGVSTGTGMSIRSLSTAKVIGVIKAYTTRVGGGPFPTEDFENVGDFLGKNGNEFGTTTGRPRRCGWLDLVVVKYSTMLNGYDELNLTKLDVLSGLDTLKIAVAYTFNGQELHSFPADLSILSQVNVVYKLFEGWKQDITSCETFSDLPMEAQAYVSFIEHYLEIPCSYIGVGPSRNDMIQK